MAKGDGKTPAAKRLLSWGAAPAFTAEYRQLLPAIVADAAIRDWAHHYAGSHAGRCDWDASFIAANFAPRRILNIGAAPFLFEAACRKRLPAAEIVSLDLAPERFSGLERVLGVRAVKLDVETASSEDIASLGTFDLIVLSEVFEHLRIDLLGTIRRLASLLDPGGRLYLTTPNGGSLKAIKRNVLHRRSGPDPVDAWSKLERLGHMGHVREYSAREVESVLGHCGLATERRHYAYHRKVNAEGALKGALFAIVPALADNLTIVGRKSG